MAEFKKLINPPIKASEIDSESATSGQVLQADGNGGASWRTPSGNKKYMHQFLVGKDGSFMLSATIINDSATPIVATDNLPTGIYYCCSGTYIKNFGGEMLLAHIDQFKRSSGNVFNVSYRYLWNLTTNKTTTGGGTSAGITVDSISVDIVTEI